MIGPKVGILVGCSWRDSFILVKAMFCSLQNRKHMTWFLLLKFWFKWNLVSSVFSHFVAASMDAPHIKDILIPKVLYFGWKEIVSADWTRKSYLKPNLLTKVTVNCCMSHTLPVECSHSQPIFLQTSPIGFLFRGTVLWSLSNRVSFRCCHAPVISVAVEYTLKRFVQ